MAGSYSWLHVYLPLCLSQGGRHFESVWLYNRFIMTSDLATIPVLDRFRRPLRDLRISVTDRCNFRCPYCMPAEIYGDRYQFLPRESLLTFEEIARLTRILVKLGVVKVRITGGEPLVRAEIDKLIAMLARVPGIEDLTMTTNAFLLAQFADKLKDAGLQRITISLDSLDDEVFRQMNGRNFGTERVLEGIEAADRVGLRPIKINAVVQRGGERSHARRTGAVRAGARLHSPLHRVHGRRGR